MTLRTTANRTKIACSVNRPYVSDVGYETIQGYDVQLPHFARHSRKQPVDSNLIVWVRIVWKIFSSTAYVKNLMKFRTTTNRTKIALV